MSDQQGFSNSLAPLKKCARCDGYGASLQPGILDSMVHASEAECIRSLAGKVTALQDAVQRSIGAALGDE